MTVHARCNVSASNLSSTYLDFNARQRSLIPDTTCTCIIVFFFIPEEHSNYSNSELSQTNYHIYIFGKCLCYKILLTGVYVWTYVHVYCHFIWRWSIHVSSVLECQPQKCVVVGSNCGSIFLAVIFCQSSNLAN